MNNGVNPFVSISDLMAGVSAVVMLLLVVMVAKETADAEAKEQERKQTITEVTHGIGTSLQNAGLKVYFSSDTSNVIPLNSAKIVVTDSSISLRDALFRSASACVDSMLKHQASVISDSLSSLFKRDSNIVVYIEGHSDINPLKLGSSDHMGKGKLNNSQTCAAFDDNYSLSAARAREVRNILLKKELNHLNDTQSFADYSSKYIVVGYGPDRPICNVDSTMGKNQLDSCLAQNRRVEIRLVDRALMSK